MKFSVGYSTEYLVLLHLLLYPHAYTNQIAWLIWIQLNGIASNDNIYSSEPNKGIKKKF